MTSLITLQFSPWCIPVFFSVLIVWKCRQTFLEGDPESSVIVATIGLLATWLIFFAVMYFLK